MGCACLKFVHFSDLHLDKFKEGRRAEDGLTQRTHDLVYNLTAVIDYALEANADFILFAGDAYDTHLPRQEYRALLHTQMLRAAEKMPVFMVVGNHDKTRRFTAKHTLYEFKSLKIKNIHIIDEPVVLDMGAYYITGIPWMYGGFKLSQLPRPKDKPNYAVIHATVAEAEYRSGTTAEDIIGESTVGPDFILPLADLLDFDYVALGHIHLPQVLSVSPPVIYPGSCEVLDWGEAKDNPHGFVFYDHGSWQHIPHKTRPRYDIQLKTAEDAPAVVDSEGIYRILVSREYPGGLDLAFNLFKGAFEAKISLDRGLVVKDRRKILERLDELTPTEALKHYLNEVGEDFSDYAELWDEICI